MTPETGGYIVAPRTPKLATRSGTPNHTVSAWTRPTTAAEAGESEEAQVTLPTPSAATERNSRGLIASGTGEACSSLSAVDPATTRPTWPSVDEPSTSTVASSSSRTSTSALAVDRPVTAR